MLPDLHVATLLTDEAAQDEWELWASGEMERSFFIAEEPGEPPAPGTKRKRKKNRNKALQRKTAFLEFL